MQKPDLGSRPGRLPDLRCDSELESDLALPFSWSLFSHLSDGIGWELEDLKDPSGAGFLQKAPTLSSARRKSLTSISNITTTPPKPSPTLDG